MSEYIALFGRPIAHCPDDLLLHFVANFISSGILAIFPITAWFAAVDELVFRGLLPLDGYAEWVAGAEAI